MKGVSCGVEEVSSGDLGVEGVCLVEICGCGGCV